MLDDYITKECIIEEYLSNWFTYEELAQYLCISVSDIEDVLEEYCKLDEKLNSKVKNHQSNIKKYYEHLNKELYISEDNQKYIDIANLIIFTDCSIRQAAKEFGLGKSTIHDYIHEKLPKISIRHYKNVFDVLMFNKSFSTNNKKVIAQVLESYHYLEMGHTILEISEFQNIGWNVVQRNINTRLKRIDKSKYQKAKKILEINQMSNSKENEFKQSVK